MMYAVDLHACKCLFSLPDLFVHIICLGTNCFLFYGVADVQKVKVHIVLRSNGDFCIGVVV